MEQEVEKTVLSQDDEAERMDALRALWLAVQEDQPDEVCLLADKCDSKTPNVDGRTALMYAAFLGRAQCAHHLARADKKANVARDKDGRTPMHWACIGGDAPCVFEVVRTLPTDRVDFLLTKDKFGSSCLDMAIAMGHGEALNQLLMNVYHRRSDFLAAINLSKLGGNPLGILATLGNHGFADRVVKMVAKVDPNERDEQRRTPLHVAASLGSVIAVRTLINAGADPRAIDSVGRLPLHACAASDVKVGLVDVARILIPLCDTYWVDNDGESSLMAAVNANHPDIAMELLAHSEPGLLDFKGRGAQERAIERGYAGVLSNVGGQEFLRACQMAAGPSVDALSRQTAKDIHGRNFIQAAESGDATKLLQLLNAEDARRAKSIKDKGEDAMDAKSWTLNMVPLVNRIDSDGCTALMVAALHGHADCVELLLSRGADPKARDRWNRTALMSAVKSFGLESEVAKACVKLLIPVSYADARANGGANALEMSIRFMDGDCFDLLAKVSRLDYIAPELLLLSAAREGNDWAIKRFIPEADLSVEDPDGNVAFDLAKSWRLKSEGLDLLRSLLGKNPSVEFLGQRLMRQIKQHDDFKFAFLVDETTALESKVVKDGSAMIVAASSGKMDYAMKLLEHSDRSAVDFNGLNVLMIAVSSSNTEVNEVRALMRRVDVDAQDNDGMTAAMHAFEGCKVALEPLLKASDLSLRDKRGRTLLMFAARSEDELPKILLTKNDPNAVDSGGQDALMYAARFGRLAHVEALLPLSNPLRANNDGLTALHLAAGNDQVEVVKILLPLSNPDALTVSGLNVLALAKREGAKNAAKFLATVEKASKEAMKAAKVQSKKVKAMG